MIFLRSIVLFLVHLLIQKKVNEGAKGGAQQKESSVSSGSGSGVEESQSSLTEKVRGDAVDSSTNSSQSTGSANQQLEWLETPLQFRAKKKAISLRINEDVLNWYKDQGDGYQTLMHAVLTSYYRSKHV